MRLFLMLVATILPAVPVAAETLIPPGTIDGDTLFAALSPYALTGDVIVRDLVVEPGVTIQATGPYSIDVRGRLVAIGTEADSIVFTIADTVDSWRGIFFDRSFLGNILEYCRVENSNNSGIRIDNASPTIRSCLITSNAALLGGGVNVRGPEPVTIEDSEIRANLASGPNARGGGVHAEGPLTLVGCVLSENRAEDIRGCYYPTVSAYGGGIYASGVLTLRNVALIGNSTGTMGYDEFSYGGAVCAAFSFLGENVVAVQNTASGGGCAFASRTYQYYGGAFYLGAQSTLSNCILSENSAGHQGGGIFLESDVTAALVNCAIVFNSLTRGNTSSGIAAAGNGVTLRNSIVYYNLGTGSSSPIAGNVAAEFCDIEGGRPGAGNVDLNPEIFLDPAAPLEIRIATSSPCIDIGDSASSFNDSCFPPSLGGVRNDMGAHGGPLACGWVECDTLGVPRRPDDLSVEDVGGSVALTWSANCETDLKEYRVYRATRSPMPKTRIATIAVGTEAYTDAAATANTPHYYAVTAVDSTGGESDPTLDAFIVPGDTQAPSAPAGLALAMGDSSLTLTWAANLEPDLAHYVIYRGPSITPTDSIAKASATATALVDRNVQPGQQYCYRIRAVDLTGLVSDYSASVCAAIEVADLAVSGRTTTAAPNMGQEFTVTFVLRNLGPSAASDVNVEVPTPPSLTFGDDSASAGSFLNGFWRVPMLAAGDSALLTLDAVANDLSRAVVAARVASSGARDPSGTNDSTAVVITPPQADLRLAMSVDDTSPIVGAPIVYTIDLTNQGSATATGITIADSIPLGATLDSSFATAGTYDDGEWSVPTLGNAATARLTLRATIAASGSITNTAEIIHADQFDPNPNNNIASATTSDSLANLSVTLIVDQPNPKLGNSVTYTLTLANGGPARATNVSVLDAAPTGLAFTTVTPTAGTYADGVWQVPAILSGDNQTLTLIAKTGRTGSITNTATITGSDQADPVAANNSAGVMITVADNPVPQVEVEPTNPTVVDTTAGDSIDVAGDASDNSRIASVTLSYRQGGQTAFSDVPMETLGGAWVGAIPPQAFTSRGILYFMKAEDSDGLQKESPRSALNVTVASVSSRSPQHAGRLTSDYRLIAPPLDLADKTPATLLVDDLGGYDIRKWRFFHLDEDETFVEYPDIANQFLVVPGRAFLLAVADEGKRLDTGSGTTVPLDREFAIELREGWNLVGNPFDFSIPVADVRLESGDELDLRAFEGDWQAVPTSGDLVPFAGYACFSLQDGDRLVINPGISAQKKPAMDSRDAATAWKVRIVATTGGARDGDNVASVFREGASTGWDRNDRAEPPVFGDYVSVGFPHAEWGLPVRRFGTDARLAGADGYAWSFDVATRVAEDVSLEFVDVSTVPSELDVVLIDEFLRTTTNLREQPRYAFRSHAGPAAAGFTLVVGTSRFVAEHRAGRDLIPAGVVLESNVPNPFNPVTTIRFGIPRESRVTLRIFDVAGREVRTLLNSEVLPAGYHSARWNGENNAGGEVGSGVYLYRVGTDNDARTSRMLLLK